MLGNIYKVLKPDGEIFIIANRHPVKTNQTVKISFKTVQEQKNFLLFCHIFKTRKRYKIKDKTLRVNIFELQRYLGGLYVEQEVLDRLSGDQDIGKMTLKDIDNLPYLNFPLGNEFAVDQQKVWPRLLSIYFNEIFHKPLIPDSVKSEWKRRFSVRDYSPDYMLIHLAQKQPLDTIMNDLKNDIMKSRLAGCPLPLLADYRDSFDYLIRTLNVLNNIKNDSYSGLPEIFIDRLREPLENSKRRYSGLNDVLKLMSKINKLEKIQSHLNPDMIEGARTKVLENLEILPFYGFSYGELKEIFLIIVGHSTMGRILSGKMNEKTLKPVSDLARTYDSQQALNLLRYCRLMSMAETVASRRTDMNQGQLSVLFDLFDTMVRVVTSREMDWDRLQDEKITAMGGIHNKIIQRLLMMMNYFEFLNNWAELRQKGEMEKESLADYDDEKMASIEDIINLVRGMERFENKFLKDDPLQLPIFYRKILNTEFHGTGHIFERIDSQLVFMLLWITVNVSRGEVINFNPILAGVKLKSIDDHVKKVEEEARSINFDFLYLTTLNLLGEQLYKNGSAFIANTGFQLRLDQETQAVEITFIDVDQDIAKFEILAKRLKGHRISEIPAEELEEMEGLTTNLESFSQDYRSLQSQGKSKFNVPERQQRWFEKAQDLRKYIKSSFMDVIFEPEDIYTDLDQLYRHSPSILHFILPEFLALQNLKSAGKIYLKSPIIDHILISTRKIQALIRGNRKEFQDVQTLYKLAQREFGPMAAGIVGLNESQVEKLEVIVKDLRHNQALFEALVKSFIFQDLGLIPALRERYRDQFNSADQAQAGAFFLEKEKIPLRYNMDNKAQKYLILLVRHHDQIHHMVRGEFSFNSLQAIIDIGDKELFEAFFVSSFVMCSALGDDLILEDLASRLFQIRALCHGILDGEITILDHLEKLYCQRGYLFYAIEEYHQKGLPMGMTPAEYLASWEGDELEKDRYIQAGKKILSMERIFRLKGLKYIEFSDLVNLIVKVPLRFVFKKKNFFGIGFATFEKEAFEALRIYNSIQRLPEAVRHYILEHLDADKVRIFGFENVSIYLNYENMIKLLLITLLGSQKMNKDDGPICLDFLGMVEKIKKRYEVVNDYLNDITVEKIWEDRYQVTHFFKAKTGLLLHKDDSQRVLTVDFMDRINTLRKISHMKTISDVDQLKNYFHYSLQSLRKSPFFTDDYELQLEDAFNKRLEEISDLILDQVKKQMELLKDFKEIHRLYTDLMDRSLDIGFTEDQNHRLNDLYELRKDELKMKKLEEINGLIEEIQDISELKDYWDGIKWYLLNNRAFLGKEIENLIARNFDEAIKKIKDMSFEAHLVS